MSLTLGMMQPRILLDAESEHLRRESESSQLAHWLHENTYSHADPRSGLCGICLDLAKDIVSQKWRKVAA